MQKRIVVIQGHPDSQSSHLGHALARAYSEAATAGGHEVRTIEIAQLDFPLLRTAEHWRGPAPASLQAAQETIGWANHLVVIFPLWTGTMPALTKAFFEQVAKPGVAFRPRPDGKGLAPGWSGKTARIVVTMGMPAWIFRWVQRAPGVRYFTAFLAFCGVSPSRLTCIGEVDKKGFSAEPWLAQLRALGRAAE